MEVDNFQISTNVAMTADRFSAPIDAAQYSLADIQAVWTGTPTGTLYLQTSDDVGTTEPDGSVVGLTNWSTYTGSATPAGGAAGDFSWKLWANTSKWVRLAYLFTSGTGTLNARVQQKGP